MDRKNLLVKIASVPIALIILITISQYYNNRDKHLLPTSEINCQCECK